MELGDLVSGWIIKNLYNRESDSRGSTVFTGTTTW